MTRTDNRLRRWLREFLWASAFLLVPLALGLLVIVGLRYPVPAGLGIAAAGVLAGVFGWSVRTVHRRDGGAEPPLAEVLRAAAAETMAVLQRRPVQLGVGAVVLVGGLAVCALVLGFEADEPQSAAADTTTTSVPGEGEQAAPESDDPPGTLVRREEGDRPAGPPPDDPGPEDGAAPPTPAPVRNTAPETTTTVPPSSVVPPADVANDGLVPATLDLLVHGILEPVVELLSSS